MAFKNLDDFLVVKPIVLTIRGRQYACPGSISGKTWLVLQRLAANVAAGKETEIDDEIVSDLEQEKLLREMCGSAFDEMLADGITSAELKHVFATLMAYHIVNPDTAALVWERGEGAEPGEAEAAPNRAARRHPAERQKSAPPASRAASKSKTKAQHGETSSISGIE